MLCNISLPRNIESSFITTLYRLFFSRTKRHLWSSSLLSATWQHCYWQGAVEDWRVRKANIFRITLKRIAWGQLVTLVAPERTNDVLTVSSIILMHCNAIRRENQVVDGQSATQSSNLLILMYLLLLVYPEHVTSVDSQRIVWKHQSNLWIQSASWDINT